MDDEAKEENVVNDKRDSQSNKNTFTKRILFDKRVWKFISLYYLVYVGSRRILDPWYKKPKYKSNISLSLIDRDTHMIQGIIGTRNSHKPSSNLSLIAGQMMQNLLFLFKAKPSWKHYAFPTAKQVDDSL
eukprot:293703_1